MRTRGMPVRSRAVRAALRRVLSALPLLTADLFLVVAAWVAAVLLRYDSEVPAAAWRGLAAFLPLAVGVTLFAHLAVGLYTGILRFASVLEARQIVIAQTGALFVIVPLVVVTGRPVPLSVPIIAMLLCCGGSGALRFWSRLMRWRQLSSADVQRVIVLGAGEAGGALVRDFSRQPGIRVVAVLDDDPRLYSRTIHGTRVHGRIDELPGVVEATGATRAVLAIAGADPHLVRELATVCGRLGLALSVVPPPAELLGRQVSLQDVRDLEITDLLGRPQVDTDLDDIGALLRGRRVLITGGGGSIGSELARQVSLFEPARLVILDHDETHLFDAAALLPATAVQRLADIRDLEGLRRVFAQERPEVVFHAAALKHVPLLESHPVEAVATNVLGTRNVVRCAREVGVQRFVQISTDKAVRPSSVMGKTKLLCEHLVLGGGGGVTSCAVRFGNVLGSRGSVVPTFIRQIRAGGPVTITDGRMTRYFMSIPEAVRLVLHAAALSKGGEIFMLDMGEPVRILDLAKRMIQLSGQRPGADVEIRVTSIRPGEKLAEQLADPEEKQGQTSHPAIVRLQPLHVSASTLNRTIADLTTAVELHDSDRARQGLDDMVASRARLIAPARLPEQRTTITEDEPAWT